MARPRPLRHPLTTRRVNTLNLQNDAAAALAKQVEALGDAAAQDMRDRVNVLRGVMPEAGDGATLVGGMYGAQTTEEMEVVLSGYIAPSGSYVDRCGKPAPRYFSMNAHVGFGSGTELMRGTAETTTLMKRAPSFAAWLVMDFGPKLGWRICDGGEHPTNIGLFPVVDLGNLARFRTENTETMSYPEVDLCNVFAPGLYGTIGVSKWASTFAVQLGGSWAPALRRIGVDGEKETRSGVRLGAKP